MGSKTSIQLQCPNCGAYIDKDKHKSPSDECPRCGFIGFWPETGEEKTTNSRGRNRADLADGKDSGGQNSKNFLPNLERISLRPYEETLPEDIKFSDSSPSQDNDLVNNYIVPHLQSLRTPTVFEIGTRLQIKEVDFEVVACKPPRGIAHAATKVAVSHPPLSALREMRRIHVLPLKASLPPSAPNEAKLFDNHIRPYFTQEERHIRQGQNFTSGGIQFHVRQADPIDGRVTRETNIYSSGPPIEDLKKVHILPIYESLPNSEKDIDEKATFDKYLKTYFSGRQVFLSEGLEFKIDGVDFKVVGAEPKEGVVTNETELYAGGGAIKAEDIKRQQMERDEEMARRLQQQESGGLWQRGRTSPEYLRMRLQNTLRMMPANDPNRALVEQLHNQLARLPYIPQQSMNQSLAQLLRQQPIPQGVPQTVIQSLPTRVYKKNDDGKEAGSKLEKSEFTQ